MREDSAGGVRLEREVRPILVGDRVRTGVFVLGAWQPMSIGDVVAQTPDGTVSDVDVMSLHGGQPWIHKEATSHLRREA